MSKKNKGTDEFDKIIKEVKNYFKDYTVKEIVNYSHNEKAFKNLIILKKLFMTMLLI